SSAQPASKMAPSTSTPAAGEVPCKEKGEEPKPEEAAAVEEPGNQQKQGDDNLDKTLEIDLNKAPDKISEAKQDKISDTHADKTLEAAGLGAASDKTAPLAKTTATKADETKPK
ncbi:unnamed protein product, partial [Effrenium voratum]